MTKALVDSIQWIRSSPHGTARETNQQIPTWSEPVHQAQGERQETPHGPPAPGWQTGQFVHPQSASEQRGTQERERP